MSTRSSWSWHEHLGHDFVDACQRIMQNRLVHDLAQEERAPKVPLLITMIITFILHNLIMHDDTSSRACIMGYI
jgi:hypothetical protein